MLSTKVTAHLVNLNGSGTDIETRIDYTSFDPWAIHLQFKTGAGRYVDWRFDRGLLIAGMASHSWVGDGDVRVSRIEDQVALLLVSPSGEALFFFDLIDISQFIGRTLQELPLGDELASEVSLLAGLAG